MWICVIINVLSMPSNQIMKCCLLVFFICDWVVGSHNLLAFAVHGVLNFHNKNGKENVSKVN